jgi:anti-sigma B factor antagonist
LNLAITVHSPEKTVRIVDLHGEIEIYTSQLLKERMNSIVQDGANTVVLNLENVEYLDSTGLGVLIGTLKKLKEAGGQLLLAAPGARVMRVLEITGLDKVFDISATVAEAAAKLGVEP